MRYRGVGRCLWLSGLALLMASSISYAQKSSSSGGTGIGGTTTPGAGTGSTGRSPSSPSATQPLPGTTGPQNGSGVIFLSGRVATDDGSSPNTEIRIERVCGTSVHLEAHVDNKGRFSFQLGNNSVMDIDASTDGSLARPAGTSASSSWNSQNSNGSTPSRFGTNNLIGCELRASYPGYHSDSINLAGREMMDNPDVGTIVLHHIGKVEGTTTSLTTLEAPKQARKHYEKGMALLTKGKLDEAQQKFTDATNEYPQYAIAWFATGQIAEKQQHWDVAQKAFGAAVKADPRYVSPYDQLAFVAAQQNEWQSTAEYSQKVIDMNPVEFPSSFWYNALANYNLKKSAAAEKSARALVRLDTQHQYPAAEKMLAQLALDKGENLEAATHIRSYLSTLPHAPDAAEMRDLLTKVESRAAVQPH